MDDRDLLHTYLIIRNLRLCTPSDVANLTDLPEHEVERVLAELVGEGIASEVPGRPRTYRVFGAQEELLLQKAANLILHLRGAS